METHIIYDVMLLLTAYTVWQSVNIYRLEGNIHRIYKLCEDIFLTKQRTRALHEHYSFVKSKWEDKLNYSLLLNLRPLVVFVSCTYFLLEIVCKGIELWNCKIIN